MAERKRIQWPGPVVVGAGVSGILSAFHMAESGYQVLLIDAVGLASGQTGHCHGYLHQGYIYDGLGEAEANLFREARDRWRLLGEKSSPVDVQEALVGFSDPATSDRFTRRWNRLRMPFDRVGPVPSLSGIGTWYRTGETVARPIDLVRHLTTVDGLTTLRGSVRRIASETRGRNSTAVIDLLAAGLNMEVEAPAAVLCAGLGLPDLAASSGFRWELVQRRSFMLVVRSDVMLPGAFVMPGHQTRGLFTVRRRDGASWVYLISDYSTLQDDLSVTQAAETWLGHMGPLIERYLPELWADRNCRYGFYLAPKIEPPLSSRHPVPPARILDTGTGNVCAMCCGKLTLSPILADELASWARSTLGRPGRATQEPPTLPVVDPLKPSTEQWESVPLVSRFQDLVRPGFEHIAEYRANPVQAGQRLGDV